MEDTHRKYRNIIWVSKDREDKLKSNIYTTKRGRVRGWLWNISLTEVAYNIGTRNHMFGRAICIFKNFKIARVKQGQFQNFQKSRAWFI